MNATFKTVMLWIGLYPDEIARFVARIGEYVAAINTRIERMQANLKENQVSTNILRIVNSAYFGFRRGCASLVSAPIIKVFGSNRLTRGVGWLSDLLAIVAMTTQEFNPFIYFRF